MRVKIGRYLDDMGPTDARDGDRKIDNNMTDPSPPKPPTDKPTAPPPRRPAADGSTRLGQLDTLMNESAWFPRVVPFFTYLVLLTLTSMVAEKIPATYPLFYSLQCGVVLWLLWRYRALLPELTVSFHWLAIPTGIIVFLVWVWLGMVIEEWDQASQVGLGTFTSNYAQWSIDPSTALDRVSSTGEPLQFADASSRAESVFIQMGLADHNALAWFAFSLRLLGMSIVVPLFEELFIRSLLLRSFHSAKNTYIGFIQVAQDFPIIGDKLMGTKIAEEADKQPPMFEHEFKRVPLGAISVFGIAASSIIFMLSHAPRDYAACIFCGIAYCLCLYFTRHKGLGPVCWAHGITNALIWIYTLHTDDWRFL